LPDDSHLPRFCASGSEVLLRNFIRCPVQI
jgi:hypothetical protein